MCACMLLITGSQNLYKLGMHCVVAMKISRCLEPEF